MKNTLTAYILFFLSGFGALGFHRFYLGKIGTGLLWMFTGGMAMIGSIYDFLTLPFQVREANIRQAILDSSVRNNLNKNWRNVYDGKTN
jgi:TM2 domain-containing membrane protein YozV